MALAELLLSGSILLQAAAAWMAFILAARSRRLGWLLLAGGIFMMLIRRCFSLAVSLGRDYPADAGAEITSLIISFLMVSGLAVVFHQRRSSDDAEPQGLSPRGSSSSRQPVVLAMALGLLAMVLGGGIGWSAYQRVHTTAITQAERQLRADASLVAMHATARLDDPVPLAQTVSSFWEHNHHEGADLWLLGPDGALVASQHQTPTPSLLEDATLRSDAGNVPLQQALADGGITSGWLQIPGTSADRATQEALAALVPIGGSQATIVLTLPLTRIEAQAWNRSLPWILGIAAVTLILLPMAIGCLHWSYTIERQRARRLEQRMVEAQKMEAIGRLASGVAHDFNNLLTVISGAATLMIRRMPEDHPERHLVDSILESTDLSANLTAQLLAYSRQQELAPVDVDLNAIVVDMEDMLERLVEDEVTFQYRLAEHPIAAHVDPHQIERVLMNLVINARDALQDRRDGTITIATTSISQDRLPAPVGSIPPTPADTYAVLSVHDNGCGMDAATLRRACEPFFSTKEADNGTGLGLAMVVGIVQQSGGSMAIESTPGQGTAVQLSLPLREVATPSLHETPPTTDRAAELASAKAADPAPATGLANSSTPCVLVVEDLPQLRELVLSQLVELGYHALTAENGAEALQILRDRSRPVDLVISDVRMPVMGGPELRLALQELAPGTPFIYISGYADSIENKEKIAGIPFIEKPFSLDELEHRLSELLPRRN